MKISDITIGVTFTRRDFCIDTFFGSCIQNDKLSKSLKFLIVDNSCDFDLDSRIKNWLKNHEYKIVRNEKVESLAYNHNLILRNSETDYIIHNNDEVYFREEWLKNTLIWILNNNIDKIAHLCRCSKGYHKNSILKMGYFNELIQGKDGSDGDIEYREMKYLENRDISVEQWKVIESQEFRKRIIRYQWYKEWFEPSQSDSWIGKIAVQPDNIANNKKGDSNLWLKNENRLSEKNKQIVIDWWSVLGKQGLEDIYPEYTKTLKQKYG